MNEQTIIVERHDRRGRIAQKLHNIGAVLVAIVVIIALMGAGYVVYTIARNAGMFQIRKLQAEADKAQALADLHDQRQQTITLLPGVIASLADTFMVGIYAAGDRLLNVVLFAALIWSVSRKGKK